MRPEGIQKPPLATPGPGPSPNPTLQASGGPPGPPRHFHARPADVSMRPMAMQNLPPAVAPTAAAVLRPGPYPPLRPTAGPQRAAPVSGPPPTNGIQLFPASGPNTAIGPPRSSAPTPQPYSVGTPIASAPAVAPSPTTGSSRGSASVLSPTMGPPRSSAPVLSPTMGPPRSSAPVLSPTMGPPRGPTPAMAPPPTIGPPRVSTPGAAAPPPPPTSGASRFSASPSTIGPPNAVMHSPMGPPKASVPVQPPINGRPGVLPPAPPPAQPLTGGPPKASGRPPLSMNGPPRVLAPTPVAATHPPTGGPPRVLAPPPVAATHPPTGGPPSATDPAPLSVNGPPRALAPPQPPTIGPPRVLAPPVPATNLSSAAPPLTNGPPRFPSPQQPLTNGPPRVSYAHPSDMGIQRLPVGGPGPASYPPMPPTGGPLRGSYGMEAIDLLQNRHILPPKGLTVPKPKLQSDLWNSQNCSSDIFRCTLNKIPETDAILKKSRLPLGVLIHPFKDLSHLPVIQCQTIVRCRQCRTYINPFVHFVDQRRWRCNVCYRVNELPEEFLYDPVSKTYGDPSRRPECKSSTIEFIAPAEYMLRPPQPAVYVFCLDVSHAAVESGYLGAFCECLLDELDKLPGDMRTQIGFITYDRNVHFYSMPEGTSQPTQLNVSDIDDMFLPSPSDLLVNLHECRDLVTTLLSELPNMFAHSNHTQAALGAALQAAYKMTAPTGGRISIFQVSLPNIGPGAVKRQVSTSSSGSSGDSAALLGPANDFYKKLALDCSGQQIAVDLFTMSSQFVDLATLSGISKFSGGQIQHFGGYHHVLNTAVAAKFDSALRRYLTRKIGFEAVMRIRCTRGLTPHTFHGNFFVRSTDLLSLPNINPDAGFAMQVAIEDDLKDSREVTFQAALLYTSSKGERRIRVHTMCLPTCSTVPDVINGADQQAIVGMLAKFASERALNDSLGDAREGLVVSCVDALETYKTYSSLGNPQGLLISNSLRLLPLVTLACMRSIGFRPGQKLDDRSNCLALFKTLPLTHLMQYIYPDLYRVDELSDEGAIEEDDVLVPQPGRLQLSYEHISAIGLYLLDVGDCFYLYVTRGLHQFVLERIFGVTRLHSVDESMTELPELENPESERLRTFVHYLNGKKAFAAPVKVIREDGKQRQLFVERMVEDRMDNSFSYYEFLQNLKQQLK